MHSIENNQIIYNSNPEEENPQFLQEQHCSSKRNYEPIDKVHIFTLLNCHSRDSWTIKSCLIKEGKLKNCLEIDMGNPDGIKSNLTVWGGRGGDVNIKWALSYFN